MPKPLDLDEIERRDPGPYQDLRGAPVTPNEVRHLLALVRAADAISEARNLPLDEYIDTYDSLRLAGVTDDGR